MLLVFTLNSCNCTGCLPPYCLCMHTFIYAVSPNGSVQVEVMNNSVLFVSNEAVILDCIARGGPENTFEWLVDGGVIENETVATLTLDQVIGAEYTCRVSNAAGSGNASITLTGKIRISIYMT